MQLHFVCPDMHVTADGVVSDQSLSFDYTHNVFLLSQTPFHFKGFFLRFQETVAIFLSFYFYVKKLCVIT